MEDYLAYRLERAGYTVMTNKKVGRIDWNKLQQEIKQSRNIVCILKKHDLDPCIEEGDLMRKEIACALKNKRNVIPLMTQDFIFPKDLPAEISELAYHNGVVLYMEYIDAVMERLITRLNRN